MMLMQNNVLTSSLMLALISKLHLELRACMFTFKWLISSPKMLCVINNGVTHCGFALNWKLFFIFLPLGQTNATQLHHRLSLYVILGPHSFPPFAFLSHWITAGSHRYLWRCARWPGATHGSKSGVQRSSAETGIPYISPWKRKDGQ